MKTSNYIIRIPEPCHEDWNKMQPDDKGKFCGSCSKSVFDFSNKTDDEIKDILIANKDKHVCGHFKKTQINRPLNIRINFNNLPKNISTTRAFAIALFLSFGSLLFSCTAIDGKKIDTIEIVNSIEEVETPDQLPPDSILTNIEKTAVLGGIEYNEETVDGGIRFEEVIVEEPPIKKDLPPDTLIVEEMLMGLMVIDPEPIDTTVIELMPDNFKKVNEEIIIKQENKFSVYPNPGAGEFIIKYDVLKRADVNIDIFDLKGTLIRSVVNIPGQFQGKYQVPVNLNNLPNGIYIVNLLNDGKKFTEKVIIKK